MDQWFQQVFTSLNQHLPQEEIKTWLEDLKLIQLDQQTLIVATSSPFKKDRILRSYKEVLHDCLREIAPFSFENLQIDVQTTASVNPSQAEEPEKQSQTNSGSSIRESYNGGLHPENTFDKFVECDFNRLPYQFARQVVAKIGQVSPLYFHGPVGTGKTHLMQAIGHYFKEQLPWLKVKYINPNDFVNEFTKALYEKSDRQFRLRYKSLDVLLFDDIQFFKGKEKSSIEFFHIFNEVYQPDKQLVFASDQLPEELDHINVRLKSRLSQSAIVKMAPPDKHGREAIFHHYLSRYGLRLSEELLATVLPKLPADIRKIIGLVKTLKTYSEIQGLSMNAKQVLPLLSQLEKVDPDASLSPSQILHAVSQYAHIPVRELKSNRRTKAVSHYRQILMYLLRERGKFSYTEIGNLLDGKTHGTVIHGCKTIAEEKKKDVMLQEVLDTIWKNAAKVRI